VTKSVKSKLLKEKFQSRFLHFILSRCARFQSRQPVLKTELPMLPQAHWPCPNLDCSNRAQSCRRKFDEARPFVRGFADSNFWLRGIAVTRRRKHPKILNDGDAFINAAMNDGVRRIRIYSCTLNRICITLALDTTEQAKNSRKNGCEQRIGFMSGNNKKCFAALFGRHQPFPRATESQLDSKSGGNENVYFTGLDFLKIARGNFGSFGQFILRQFLADALTAHVRAVDFDSLPFFFGNRHDILHRGSNDENERYIYRETISDFA
jgi:hypothetical protein